MSRTDQVLTGLLAALAVVGCNVDFSTRTLESTATGTDTSVDLDARDTAVGDTDTATDVADVADADVADADVVDADVDVASGCPDTLAGLRYARTLTVTTGAAGVEAGYSVSFELPAATLAAEGKLAEGLGDLRVAFCRDGELELIPVALDISVFASQDGDATPLWFALQAPLEPSSTTSDYLVLYGDPARTESVLFDWDGVFLASGAWFGENPTPLAPAFEAATAGAGTVDQTIDGQLVRAPVADDAALVVTSAPLPADRRVAVRHLFRVVSAADALVPGIVALGIYGERPAPSPNPGQGRIVSVYASPLGHLLSYLDASGTGQHWTGQAWDPMTTALSPASGEALHYELFSDGDAWHVVVSDAALAPRFETSPVAWSETALADDPLWLMWGDDYTTQNAVEGLATYTWVRRYVDPEPTVELGLEREVMP